MPSRGLEDSLEPNGYGFVNIQKSVSVAILAQVSPRLHACLCISPASVRFRSSLLIPPVMAKSMRHYEELASKHAPMLRAEIDMIDSAQEQQIQACGSNLRQYGLQHDLMYFEEVHHSQAGVWEWNRKGEMTIAARVHKLLRIIVRKGFCDEETQLAAAVELSHGPESEVTRRKNIEHVKASGGMLAPICPESMRIATGVGSHTTSVLRLVDYAEPQNRVPAAAGLEDLTVEGFLLKKRILEKCPSMEKRLGTGLKYLVIRRQVHALVPELMATLSEADNAKHDNYQQESALETVMNIHARAMQSNASTAEDYALIVRQVSRGHDTDFQRAAQHYTEWVRECSGGKEKHQVEELREYTYTLKVLRAVPTEFWKDLALVSTSFKLYLTAMLKATMSAPDHFCKGGKARVFNSADLNSITKNKAKEVQLAHKIMIEARDLAAASLVDEGAGWQTVKGLLDVRLVMHVHGKTCPQREAFKSLMHIAVRFTEDLRQRCGELSAPCPWIVVEPAAPVDKPTGTASSSFSIHECSPRGNVTVEFLSAKGFIVDAFVRQGPEDKIYKIESMSDESANLSGDGGCVKFDYLFETYSVTGRDGEQVGTSLI